MPFIQGTAAGKVALSPFLNFRAEHYCLEPQNFDYKTISDFKASRNKRTRFQIKHGNLDSLLETAAGVQTPMFFYRSFSFAY
jgi:hypothetical protein